MHHILKKGASKEEIEQIIRSCFKMAIKNLLMPKSTVV